MLSFIKKIFIQVREELSDFSPRERGFIFFAMLCGFFICCEYSIIRPVSTALFITSYSAKHFPYAWLATVPINLVLVSLYNRLIPKWGSQKLFTTLFSCVLLLNLSFAYFSTFFPQLSFGFYIWKEIYILFMFQLLWSVIHSNVNLKKAKYLYGMFFGMGGLGSIFGSSFPSFFAVAYGSETLIYLTLPIYILLFLCYRKMSSLSQGLPPRESEEKRGGGFTHGLRLISQSRFLIFALLIVCFMQLSAAIADFQFNDFLERTVFEKDIRTQVSGRVFGIVHILTVAFQFIGSFLVIQWMGIRRAHYFVPSMLLLSTALLGVLPIFPIVSLAFIMVKSLDFSIFGVIKEMLYVPLKPEEKYQAKAVIDIFAYRSSKALASLMIIFVQFAFVRSTTVLMWLSLALALCWIASVAIGLRGFEKFTKQETSS